ncbi:hypothetical protein DFP72DRAFT_1122335 [Ephemerocybe angulata]|uniref:DNA 3'-5' helicase n=1 Tax=Ephemerocybe angulata TaxID=980116 RepID=A0A8H6LRH4_9AGAR|nr:hypothetical protein DFP72DRAFT_1122335 [Tulosesus angulatus]
MWKVHHSDTIGWCFLALFLLKEDGVFALPKDTTPVIAKLTRMIQLTILREMYRLQREGKYASLDAALTSLEPDYRGGRGTTTMEMLEYHQSFATALTMQTTGLPRVVWHRSYDNDYTTLMFCGQPVSITDFKTIYSRLEHKAISLLENDVLLGVTQHVDLGTPKDSFNSTAHGYSFIHAPDNHFSQYRKFLGRRFLSDPKLRTHFYSVDPITSIPTLNVSQCLQWLQKLAELEAINMILTEMRGGGPIRLAELCSTVACNIVTRARNLYAYGPHVLLVCQYNKTTHNHQRDVLVPHALSTFDGDMLVQIHTLARPFAEFLAAQIHIKPLGLDKYDHAYREMLFMDALHPFDPGFISQLMGKMTKPVLGWAMTISHYRHVAIAIKDGQKLLTVFEPDTDSPVDAYTDVQARQAGHSHATEKRLYGLSPDIFEGVPGEMIQLYIRSSREWQQCFDVVPAGAGLAYRESTMENYNLLVARGEVKPARATTNTSPSPTVADLYALLQQSIAKSEENTQALRADIREMRNEMVRHCQCSKNTTPKPPPIRPTGQAEPSLRHQVASLPPSPETSPPRPTPAPPPSATQATSLPLPRHPQVSSNIVTAPLVSQPFPHRAQPLAPPPAAPTAALLSHDPTSSPPSDMRAHLRRLYGHRADWSDKGQRDATQAIMDLTSDVFVILRTGVGKTATIVLPSLVEDATTVVLVPLISLLDDWKRRLSSWRIPFEEFDTARYASLGKSGAKIILASADKSRSPQWKEALSKLNMSRPVARIVFDEAHLWFMDAKFRQGAMLLPSTHRTFPMQFVLVSATISPDLERAMARDFAMIKPTTIRNHPHRPELKYLVKRGLQSVDEMVAEFKTYLAEMQIHRQWSDRDRWMVFVTSIEDGKYVASLLGVEFYHSDSDANPITREERASIYHRWTSGHFKGMVATPAVSVGTDYPHTRLTAHFTPPFDIYTLVQQTSRAGRDGSEALCLVFCLAGPLPTSQSDHQELRGITALRELVELAPGSPEPCVRGAIGMALEGVGISCSDLSKDWQVCSACELRVSRSGFTNSSIPHLTSPRTFDLLPPPDPVQHTALKWNLRHHFQSAVDQGILASSNDHEEKDKQVEKYRAVLNAVGQACGICCLRERGVSPATHEPFKCPHRGLPQPLISYRKLFDYSKEHYDHAVCYKCHTTAFWKTHLHPLFEAGQSRAKCPAPHFMEGLLFELSRNDAARAQLGQAVGQKWNTEQEFVSWVLLPNREHSCNAMVVMLWFGNAYLDKRVDIS